MAVYILRPNDIGHYNSIWDIDSSSGWTTYWENLNETDQDGDANFVFTSEPGAFTVGVSDFSAGAFARPCRIPGITVIATVRPDTPNPAVFRFRLRYSGYDYDSEPITVSSAGYVEVFKTYSQLPNGDGWNAVRLSDLEVGLYYESGEPLRCTKLEVQVYTELYPHYTLIPDGAGTHQGWLVQPNTAPPHMAVESFDGSQSYIHSNTLWETMGSVSNATLRGIYGFSATRVHAVGDSGTILLYDGLRWVKSVPVTSKHLYGVWGPDPSSVFAVGETGTILHYDGTSWSAQTSGVTESLFAVWGTSSTDVFAVGATGTAVHYDGVSWTPMVTGTAEYLFGISGAASANVFAVGTNGTILWWNGAVWAPQVSGTPNDLYAVYMSSPTDAWAVGFLGTTVNYNGAFWAVVPSTTLQPLRAVWGDSPANYVAVGDTGIITHWNGLAWEDLPSPVTVDLYGVWGATSYRVFVVGTTDTILAHDDVTWWPVYTFTSSDLPAILAPPVIDHVIAACSVKNYGTTDASANVVLRSGGVDYYGATGTDAQVVPADDKWHVIDDVYLNDPATGWPSGLPGSTPWTPAEVGGLEVGIANAGGDLRCTSMALEVFLRNIPLSTTTLVPIADGYYHSPIKVNRIDVLFPGPPAWQDVMDDPPDFGATYISGDATAAGMPLYGTFQVTALAPLPVGQQIYFLEHHIWLRVPPGSDGAVVAPVFRHRGSSETYVGRPYAINNTGGSWFLLRNSFFTSPFTSQPWTVPEVNLTEVGVVILSGQAWITSLNVSVNTCPLLLPSPPPPDPTDLQLTNAATTLMTRSKLDGTIYAVTEFAVGSGGFVPATPWQVVPVNPADLALAAEIYRGRIERISYDADALPWTVKYWCRMPRGVAIDRVGEIGLLATILWSPFPAEIGTQFLFALQHQPCQCRHGKIAHLFEVTVEYP